MGIRKNWSMYSQRSFSLFGDYPKRPADQSQGYGSMISDSRANNSTRDQSESPNMYSRYLERARTVRDRKEKENEDEILKQFTALNERIDRNAKDINKGITEVLENSKQNLDKLTSSIGEQISNISEKVGFCTFKKIFYQKNIWKHHKSVQNWKR